MPDYSLRRLYPGFTAAGLSVSLLVIGGFYKDQFREWKTWQSKHRNIELARATTAEERRNASTMPFRIRQIVIPELNRIDRCTTCHVTADDPSYAGLDAPLAYHPNHDQHPFEKFGCTICHQGQGLATTREAAHGFVHHWHQPLLPMKYIEAACAKCHLPADLSQAPNLSRGHALFQELGCIGCHELGGSGGTMGPALDQVGTRRSPDWLIRHFKSPASVSTGSAMPPVSVDEADIEALTLFMLSLTGDRLSEYHVSMKTIPGPEAGRRLFEEKGCVACHRIGGRGGEIGPSLDEVATRRAPEWLAAHLREPQALSPGTVMPKFNLTDQEVRALTEFLLSLSDPEVVGFIKVPSWMTPVERGGTVFKKFGCAGCHGIDGLGGVPNPNAMTAEEVPGLLYVAEGYTLEELKLRILDGQPEIAVLDPQRPPPPLYMPGWRGKVREGELDDLVAYLMNLLPKEEDLGF